MRGQLTIAAGVLMALLYLQSEVKAHQTSAPFGDVSAAVDVIDQPPLTGNPALSQGCQETAGFCSVSASQSGNFANATSTSTISLGNLGTFPGSGSSPGSGTFSGQGAFPGQGAPVLLSPQITLGGSATANPNPNPNTIFNPFAGVQSNASLEFNFIPSTFGLTPTAGVYPSQVSLGMGTLIWTEKFNISSPGPSVLQFNWGLTDATFSAVTGAFANLTCNGSCSVSSSNGVTFDPTTDTLIATMSLAHLTTLAFGVTENVELGWNADSLGISGPPGSLEVGFQDPMTLTYLDPTGNIVPNLVLFDPNIDGVLPVSAEDFSSFVSTATPLPAALPLFATGLCGLGLLGWRRKRKARAI